MSNIDPNHAKLLREHMVDTMVSEGMILSTPVENAMRTVPREVFARGAAMTEAYDVYKAIITKRDEKGKATSSVSAPQLQAYMLEQAEISAGMRILEIGSGGYNAALLAELVGSAGQVTTVDIDEDVIAHTSRLLAETGYSHVNVVLADAEHGVAEHAPYDRILVTVGAWDIPPAWTNQLIDGGRLLVPLRIHGLQRTVVFVKVVQSLRSCASEPFGFVPMQGIGAQESVSWVLRGGEVTVRFDDALPSASFTSQADLERALETPRVEVWSGVVIGRFERWDTMHLWLASSLPGFCHVVLDRQHDTGLISPPGSYSFAVGVVDAENLAYVTVRAAASARDVELGVHAFGPSAAVLAERVAEQIRVWAKDYRAGNGPEFRVFFAKTFDYDYAGKQMINKKHCKILMCW